jgi:DNA-binding transcriptional ArsR family regulator
LTDVSDKGWLHPEKVRSAAECRLQPGQADMLAAAFVLLADPTRLRMLHALACADELCVFDLGLLLDLKQPTVSQQLRVLRDRGVVSRRRVGRAVFYGLDDLALRDFLSAFDGRAVPGALAAERSSPWALLSPTGERADGSRRQPRD